MAQGWKGFAGCNAHRHQVSTSFFQASLVGDVIMDVQCAISNIPPSGCSTVCIKVEETGGFVPRLAGVLRLLLRVNKPVEMGPIPAALGWLEA